MTMSHPNAQEAGGAVIGGTLGFIKSWLVLGNITYALAFDTAVLAAIGAVVGFVATAAMKLIKEKIKKHL
jgi:hypothetical protein